MCREPHPGRMRRRPGRDAASCRTDGHALRPQENHRRGAARPRGLRLDGRGKHRPSWIAATIHANSANKALPRLENLLLMANMGVPYEPLRAAIGETVQWMFYIQRDGATRKVSQVSQLFGYERATGNYDLKNH